MSDNKEKTFDTSRPVKYSIYKGMGGKNGAVQFKLIPFEPDRKNSKGESSVEGFVLVDASPTVDKNVYDWANKITFSMGPNDMGMFLSYVKTGGKIFHEFNGKNKTLELVLGNQDANGMQTWLLHIQEWSGDSDKKKVSLPISTPEMRVLCTLLESAIPSVLGWNYQA